MISERGWASHPSTLQSDLKHDGIPAMVTAGSFCSSDPPPAGFLRVESFQPKSGKSGRQHVADPTVTFHPSAMPAGAELRFGNFQLANGQQTSFALIDTGSYTCTSTAPTAPPTEGVILRYAPASACVTTRDQRWNHNTHYHWLILGAVPRGCQRVLEVGCGEGTLARQLARLVPHVVGIDQDASSIDLARRQEPGSGIDFICGDFLAYPFRPGSFGMITSVAALHHMDARAAFQRMSQLLAPGGTLAIVGLARSRLPVDLPWEAAAIVADLGYRLTRAYWEHPSPIVWPPPHTYAEAHALAEEALPGVRYRRHLLWRYSLIWTNPASTARITTP